MYVFNNPTSGLSATAFKAFEALAIDIDMGSAGFSFVKIPDQTTKVMRYRENLDPARIGKAPGLSNFTNLILRRGSTEDRTFWKWALLSHNPGLKMSMNRNLGSLTPRTLTGDNPFPRRDLVIEALGRDGNIRRRWYILDAFVVNYKPGSFDANTNAHLMEEIQLACEVVYEISGMDEIALLAGTEVAALLDNDYGRTAAYLAQAADK